MKKKHCISVLLFISALFFTGAANACPMCQAGAQKKTVKAYEGITLLLALLPVAGGTGIFYWIYKNEKKNNSDKKDLTTI